MLDSFFPQRQGQNKVPDFSSWLAELNEQKQKWQMTFPKFDAPQLTIQMLCELTGGNGVLSTGVGQHQMWAVQ
jgi:acetolactate synthase-1/2/3 large subunit